MYKMGRKNRGTTQIVHKHQLKSFNAGTRRYFHRKLRESKASPLPVKRLSAADVFLFNLSETPFPSTPFSYEFIIFHRCGIVNNYLFRLPRSILKKRRDTTASRRPASDQTHRLYKPYAALHC